MWSCTPSERTVSTRSNRFDTIPSKPHVAGVPEHHVASIRQVLR
jgi:hypothetical protein